MFLHKLFSKGGLGRKGIAVAFLFAAAVAGINFWMVLSAREQIYTSVTAIPANSVGLVLGSSAVLPNGHVNSHLLSRLEAAASLYQGGKVRYLLLSGDNSRSGYDEPSDMKKNLLRMGVPASAMVLDEAGLRTLDSMARAKLIFGQSRLTIVTEDFHAARCVFLARHFGLEPVVLCAEELSLRWSLRSSIREVAARVVAVIDAWVLQRDPKYLGAKVVIPDS